MGSPIAYRRSPRNSGAMTGLQGRVLSLWLDKHSCIIRIDKLGGKDRDNGVLNTTKLEERLKGVSSLDSPAFLGRRVKLRGMIAIPLSEANMQKLDWDKGDWQIVAVHPYDSVRDARLLPMEYYSLKDPGTWNCFPTLAYCRQDIPQATENKLPPENVAQTIHLFRKLLGAWNNFPIEEIVNVIRNNDNFSNVRDIFPSEEEVVSFFETYPQYFSLKNENQTVVIPYRFPREEFSSFLMSNAVTSSQSNGEDVAYQLVVSAEVCKQHVTELEGRLHTGPLIVTVGCESVEPGEDGSLSLLQIGTMGGEVFLFDLLSTSVRKDMFVSGGLKELLENEKIVKVMYDCRHPQTSLFYQFGVTLKNVFDISGAYASIWDQCNFMSGPFRPSSPSDLLQVFGIHARHNTKAFEKEMRENRLFEKRPLTEEMIEYAVEDAKCWVPKVYESLNRLISPLWRPEFQSKVERWLEESRLEASTVPQE